MSDEKNDSKEKTAEEVEVENSILLEELQDANDALTAKVEELEADLKKKDSYIKGLNTKLKKAGLGSPKGLVEH